MVRTVNEEEYLDKRAMQGKRKERPKRRWMDSIKDKLRAREIERKREEDREMERENCQARRCKARRCNAVLHGDD